MIKIKKLLKGDKARAKIKEGIDLVADYTKVTLGPKGRNVALNQYGPLPTRVVNDGVTIANEISSPDCFIQSGVEMVQEICRKTNFNAGDGTTQTALLTQALIEEGQKYILTGINPIDVKKELESDLERILKELASMSNKIENVSQIRDIATIAGNNDPEIGKAIYSVMKEVGMNASIVIEKGDATRIKTKSVPGMWFDKGYRVPAFINNIKMTAEHTNPSIFLIDSELKWDDDIDNFFKKIAEQNLTRVVIIANEIEGEVLGSLALTNKERLEKGEGIAVCAIEAPAFGEDRKDIMEDIAIYTGAKVISKANGFDLDKVNPLEVAGTCKKFLASSKTTTIIEGAGEEEKVKERIKEIQGLIDQLGPTEKTIKYNLEKRRDTIQSGVGIIYAGGSTEIEIKDRQLRLEDAVLASKSAVKEGYVDGGGITYLRLTAIDNLNIILKIALEAPIKQIALNAGKNPDTILEKYYETFEGYNAKTDKFEDLAKAGVIDATLVVKNALLNAVSLASMFLTTEGIIAEELEKSGDDFHKPRLK